MDMLLPNQDTTGCAKSEVLGRFLHEEIGLICYNFSMLENIPRRTQSRWFRRTPQIDSSLAQKCPEPFIDLSNGLQT
jgi:hypothetical protein